MPQPTSIQFQQLQRLLGNLSLSLPTHVEQEDDGAVVVSAGNPYVISDSDSMDSLLNELMDINESREPDELFDEVVGLLDQYSSF